jgi:hypothetical protein
MILPFFNPYKDLCCLPTSTTSANSVFWNGQVTIAVGEGTNTIASSADLGETWTGQGTAVFSSRGNEVAWNDKRWVIAGTGTNTVAYSNDGATWWPCVGASMFTEGVGIGSNPKIGSTYVKSAVVLNSREKVCVNTPIYYDSDVANDTSLVFNLNIVGKPTVSPTTPSLFPSFCFLFFFLFSFFLFFPSFSFFLFPFPFPFLFLIN